MYKKMYGTDIDKVLYKKVYVLGLNHHKVQEMIIVESMTYIFRRKFRKF